MRALVFCLAPLVLLACGSSSTTAGNFVGTWVADVVEVEVCPDTGTHTTQLMGTFPIVAGSAAGTIVTQSTNGCDLTWTVSGDNATLGSGQTCSVPGSVGGTWSPTFTSGGLSLNNATTIGVHDMGTAVYVNGATQNCTFTQSGTFTAP